MSDTDTPESCCTTETHIHMHSPGDESNHDLAEKSYNHGLPAGSQHLLIFCFPITSMLYSCFLFPFNIYRCIVQGIKEILLEMDPHQR